MEAVFLKLLFSYTVCVYLRCHVCFTGAILFFFNHVKTDPVSLS